MVLEVESAAVFVDTVDSTGPDDGDGLDVARNDAPVRSADCKISVDVKSSDRKGERDFDAGSGVVDIIGALLDRVAFEIAVDQTHHHVVVAVVFGRRLVSSERSVCGSDHQAANLVERLAEVEVARFEDFVNRATEAEGWTGVRAFAAVAEVVFCGAGTGGLALKRRVVDEETVVVS